MDLDLSKGKWEMIGVALTNYQPLEIQDKIGTFILSEPSVLRQMQQTWDFEEVYEDYCEYHYALKFYRNGELMKTLRANLNCNYITDEAFSFRFTEKEFTEFMRYFKPIRWSRIRFSDLDLLQAAVSKLDAMPNVYWYGDVKQFSFDGEFSVTVNDLSWNVNRDSLVVALTELMQSKTGRDDFYITQKYWLLSDDFEKMSLKLNVFCNESFFKAYRLGGVVTQWRSHLSDQTFVQIVVIGMNKEEYFRAMKGHP
ncbi:MAG: hypothetical protein RLZZ165_472 [Bacteroidota bacterium]